MLCLTLSTRYITPMHVCIHIYFFHRHDYAVSICCFYRSLYVGHLLMQHTHLICIFMKGRVFFLQVILVDQVRSGNLCFLTTPILCGSAVKQDIATEVWQGTLLTSSWGGGSKQRDKHRKGRGPNVLFEDVPP